ncbi:hypothetical protein HK405_004252 [Cladochytrium tenue]|nr:hypothetical protein HK405_004252 [Cladochytrium tenue]
MPAAPRPTSPLAPSSAAGAAGATPSTTILSAAMRRALSPSRHDAGGGGGGHDPPHGDLGDAGGGWSAGSSTEEIWRRSDEAIWGGNGGGVAAATGGARGGETGGLLAAAERRAAAGQRKSSQRRGDERRGWRRGGYHGGGKDGDDEKDDEDEDDEDEEEDDEELGMYQFGEDGAPLARKRNPRRELIVTLAVSLLGLTALVAVTLGVVFGTGRFNDGPEEPYVAYELQAARADVDATVILVSLDGFRASYLSRGLTPQLAGLGRAGVRAEFLRPAFPSVTFPNHYTLVTGLYPEHHGIVGNVFFDSELNDTFVYTDKVKGGQSKWWGGEPLWVTAVKQGQRSATCMWPGSEAPITKDQIRPTYWVPYNHTQPLTERVDQVLSWLDLPRAARPTFLTIYASDVDGAGHSYGPDSAEVDAALGRVDGMIGQLAAGLRVRNLTGSVNVVVVSDHGMAQVERVVVLDDWVDVGKLRLWNNLLVTIEPVDAADEGEVLRNLTVASKATGAFQVWAKQAVPTRFHFNTGSRIPSIVLLPNLGVFVTTRAEATEAHATRGMHGYDPELPEMQAIFLAAGPAFSLRPGAAATDAGMDAFNGPSVSLSPSRSSSSTPAPVAGSVGGVTGVAARVVPGFDNVEVYGLLAHVLGLEPAPNNGTLLVGGAASGLVAGGRDV